MTGASLTWKSPQESCNELLRTLRDSNLHFIVSESPYSLQICIRKKFLKNAPEHKKPVPPFASSSSSAREGLENKVDNLTYENASLVESINNLKDTNEILHNKIENAEKKIGDKKGDIKKLEDENILQKGKMKSLEKSLKAKDKKIQNDKEKIDNARDTIAKLEAEIPSLTTSEAKLEAAETRIDVGEYLANDDMKDGNENIFETLPAGLKSRSEQKYKRSRLPLEQLSPVRGSLPTRAPLGTPSSPHTPPGFPPSSSISSELQSSAQLSHHATLSCYFAKPVSDPLHESNPISEEYIRNLSKLNLAPRIRKQEDT